ncbi:MAG: AAC(3) family N-acetyltransferase [Victivallales bacterium]
MTDDLIRAGIQPSDTLLVHSSMKSIGAVDGGADTVLDALMDYFREKGLLVFPTLTYGLNPSNPVFYVNETPSQVGLLSDLFWRRPGVLRSLHPTHSVAAWGHDAAEFIAGHEDVQHPLCERLSVGTARGPQRKDSFHRDEDDLLQHVSARRGGVVRRSRDADGIAGASAFD